jgi:hypothetical protein
MAEVSASPDVTPAKLCRHIAWDIGIADHTVCRIDGLLPSHREDA